MKTLLTIALIAFTQSLSAAIVCETPRESKTIEIESQTVTIKGSEEISPSRVVASIGAVRTKLQGNGFTKVLFHSGAKHIIHIEDRNSFSEVDDYLIIRSSEGHEITYPLNCKN